MVKKWKIAIEPLTQKKRRFAYVYLPKSYAHNRRKRYPVLYMFDGHNVFFDEDATYGKSWGLLDFLDQNHVEIIVAAIECNHSPDHGRLREYSPYDFYEEGIGFINGQGSVTMDWIVQSFKPLIDRRYRTLPDREHTFIAGSSMGGLMSVFALLHYNHIFSRAAALSPSLWIDPKQAQYMVRCAHPLPDTVLYMDYGELEMKRHRRMQSSFGKMCTMLLEKGILLDARIVPGGEHCEASWEAQIPFFLNTLLYGICDIN